MNQIQKSSGIALIPFFVFVITFLGAGILLNDFYAFPAPVAVVIGIISAFLILKGSVEAKVKALIRGCGDSSIITMCIIFLLAGSFAAVSKAVGGVDATVNFGLSVIPAQYLALGVFVLASFLSIASGTSFGTMVALGPIAVGLAAQSTTPLPLMIGALLGGAMFGDNLSFISDTTIAATQTQGCSMKDKFKVNILIAGPAALLTIALFLYAGAYYHVSQIAIPVANSFSFWLIAPYLLVLGLAIAGVNVFIVLMLGTLASGITGLFTGELDLLLFCQTVYEGFTGMTDIFLLAMLTGGLAEIVRESGGIQFLLKKVSNIIKSYHSAQLGIGILTWGINSAIANNTVSILVSGPVAKDISDQYRIDKRKTAAIIDIFACILQGLLPYGAQMLVILSFTSGEISFLDVLPYTWYQYFLLLFSLLAIYTPYVDKYLLREDTIKESKKEVAV